MLMVNAQKVMMCVAPVDFRKSIDGLSVIIADQFRENPLSGYLFVFRNKRGDKIKVLYWDQNGYALWYKRLEKGRFKFPAIKSGVFEMTITQLSWLLDGLDITKLKQQKKLHYEHVY